MVRIKEKESNIFHNIAENIAIGKAALDEAKTPERKRIVLSALIEDYRKMADACKGLIIDDPIDESEVKYNKWFSSCITKNYEKAGELYKELKEIE